MELLELLSLRYITLSIPRIWNAETPTPTTNNNSTYQFPPSHPRRLLRASGSILAYAKAKENDLQRQPQKSNCNPVWSGAEQNNDNHRPFHSFQWTWRWMRPAPPGRATVQRAVLIQSIASILGQAKESDPPPQTDLQSPTEKLLLDLSKMEPHTCTSKSLASPSFCWRLVPSCVEIHVYKDA